MRALLVAVVLVLSQVAATAGNAAAPAPISGRAFGMHASDPVSVPAAIRFGSARVWDVGSTWRDLQPQQGRTSAGALSRLDRIVATLRARGAEPVITLGMTPDWAAAPCRTVWFGVDWGKRTCPPRDVGPTSPWASYVRMLAQHYRGKVRYFDLWNEPSLRDMFNGSTTTLARMQATAAAVVHRYGAKLLSPGIVFTNGSPRIGLSWLDDFLGRKGGTAFDIVSLHLYPADAPARAGWGPEWSVGQLGAIRRVLARHHVSGRPIWNTETNVGRVVAGTTFTGTRGAAMVARTFLLATQNRIARTFWYAVDDRSWGGTWLLAADKRTLTPAGNAYRTVRSLLVNARPYGCTRQGSTPTTWRFSCRYRLADGRSMLAVWRTTGSFTYRLPARTQRVVSVTGTNRSARPGSAVKVGLAPLYVIGRFGI